MTPFMNENFLLKTEAARILYHDYAAKMPIMDYHCHLNPQEIYENRKFQNITQIWLGGDHYKWRLMRAGGVEEKYITGDAPDREKFQKFVEVLSRAIGNPLYHWSHLELQRFFGWNGYLTPENAEEVWNKCNALLGQEDFRARALIERSDVKAVCTTDDPIDSLIWHEKIAADEGFAVKVLPAWRPDKALNIEKPDFTDYIAKLAAAAEMEIATYDDLKAALAKRMEHFAAHGCKLSDHGLEYAMYKPVSEEEAAAIFAKRMAGETVTREEELGYKTMLQLFLGRAYAKAGWAMQLHYGCLRDNNKAMYAKLGPDTGYDAINNFAPSGELAGFLNALACTGELPKTLVYSLNPNDNEAIDTILNAFQEGPTVSKIQHGSGWWFNDQKKGMEDQLTSLANKGFLAGFVGMLTDSRSFLSYPRHEYFRRILCNLIGGWIEDGEYPADFELWGKVVQDISYNNAFNYFKF